MSASLAKQVLGTLAGVTIAMVGASAGTMPDYQAPAAHQGSAASAARAPGAPMQPMLGPEDGVVRQNAVNDPIALERVLEYWTPERMAAAEPAGRQVDNAPPGAADGAGPTDPQAAPRPDSQGERWTAGGKITKTTGRVYLTMDGGDFTCSASVVHADNKDTLVTAGHCLKDGKGAWAKNWTFIPGYSAGKEPLGRYVARELLVAPQWSHQADDSYDFGMAVLNTSGGKHVADRTGSQPISFGTAPQSVRYAFGYPTSGGFDGRHLHYCSGQTRPDQRDTKSSGMACRMTEGSSGGPWLSNFDTATGKGTITSVVSFKYANDESTQYGPHLGAEAKKLYDDARTM
ncbi:trypsin-like serine peptidase [Murinocardiopsis flavida]|nr:trypsin-like serine protease [Murinocardiopsis flavida]